MVLLGTFCKRIISSLRITVVNSIACSKFSTYDGNLMLRGVSLFDYIKELENKYNKLTTDSNVVAKEEIHNLETIINILNERKIVVNNISSLKELMLDKDSDIRKLAKEEAIIYENKLETIDEELIKSILPVDPEDECSSIVLEVNAGVGGQEAMLFASEVLNMYLKFTEYKGWQTQVASYTSTDLGGIRHASFLVSGSNVFRYFKYEGGVHRVQRIPTTEKTGRIHTSTISVIALPQPPEIEVDIDNKHLKIETKRASGAGGQHVNTTDSAVRVVHLPTGISVECQVDRSQIKNKQIALMKLRALIYQKEIETQIEKSQTMRKKQVRSNYRNEKIRTYNFHNDRITDHRLNHNIYNIKEFFEGNHTLEKLMDELDYNFKVESLLNIVNNKDEK